jgi:aminoglycoside 3-N-acetyltransferase I
VKFGIRRLGSADVTLVRELNALFAAAFNEHEDYQSRPPSDSYLRQILGRRETIALVATNGPEMVGALVAYVLDKLEQERSEIYIYDLAVGAAHRRQGIATALIGALKRIARDRGAWVIYVQADTGAEDAPAIALYSSLGAREDVLHFDIDPGQA